MQQKRLIMEHVRKTFFPWNNISWERTIAKCDEEYFCKRYSSIDNYINIINNSKKDISLTFNALPEPYNGDINSNVYCLNLNPGEPDDDFGQEQDKEYLLEKLCIRNLYHDIISINEKKIVSNKNTILYSPEIYDVLLKLTPKKDKNERMIKPNQNGYVIHSGDYWQKRIIQSLKKELNRKSEPKLFFIEYFPYHSKHSFHFPEDLPSNDYRNYLIEKAMEEGKYIIIMRGIELWLNIKSDNLGERIKNYSRTILLRTNRRINLSPKNYCKIVPFCEINIIKNLF